MNSGGLDGMRAALADADREAWDRGWLALSDAIPRDAARPRVLALDWGPPPTALGGRVADMIRRAGGDPFVFAPGAPPILSWEDAMEFDPQLVVIRAALPALAEAWRAWMRVEGWNRVEAAVQGRVYGLEASLLGGAGPALLEGGRMLQALIGEAFWGWPPPTDSRLARPQG